MVTSLYVVTIGTWFHLPTFMGGTQVNECAAQQERVELRFEITTVCLTRSEEILMVDKEIYQR